jgi:hypothetical protein
MHEMVMKQIVRDENIRKVYSNVVGLHTDKYIKAHMQLPYGFEHSHRVADQAQTSSQYFVGLLHDIVEDNIATEEDVKDTGITAYEWQAIDLLTRKGDKTYKQYVQSIADSGNVLAVIVKIHDLRDHLRVDAISTYSTSHIKRYTDALYVLLEALRNQR